MKENRDLPIEQYYRKEAEASCRRKSHRTGGNRKKLHDRVIWMIPLCIGFLGAFLVSTPSQKEREIQQQIAEKILRFHVLAASDSREDQAEKLRVRDAVVRKLEPVLASSSSKEETKERIRKEWKQIEKVAEEIAGPGNVQVSLSSDWFPEKAYGDCTFPEGEYEALRIEIGEAKGHNWWCVLYPGLCFKEAVRPVVSEEGKEVLDRVLDETAYDFLLHPVKMKVKFRLPFVGET